MISIGLGLNGFLLSSPSIKTLFSAGVFVTADFPVAELVGVLEDDDDDAVVVATTVF